jgi:hypothetical protein
MNSSPSVPQQAHIYSESPASPSYIASSLPSTSPHQNNHHDDDDSQYSIDSLADATDGEIEQRVNEFLADSPRLHELDAGTGEDRSFEDPNQQFDTSMNGGGEGGRRPSGRRYNEAMDPILDLPRGLIDTGGGGGMDSIQARLLAEQTEGAMEFLRAQVAKLDDTDWMYPTPDGFGTGANDTLGSRENQIGREDPSGWMDQAFNLESYPVFDEAIATTEYDDHDEEEEEEEEDEMTRTGMRFDDSIEEEEQELFGRRFSDGLGHATNQARNELAKGVEEMAMNS